MVKTFGVEVTVKRAVKIIQLGVPQMSENAGDRLSSIVHRAWGDTSGRLGGV